MTIHTFGLNTTNTSQSCEDAGMVQGFPNSPQGAGNRFYVSNVSGNQSNALIKFPSIKSVFDGLGAVTVNSVSLKFRRLNNVTAPSRNIKIRRLLVAFNQAQVTWNNRVSGTPWGTSGARGAGDASSTILATAVMPSTGGAYFTVTGSALTQWFKDVIAGTIPDYGLLIELENAATTGSGDFDIAAGEGTNGQRPFLEVDYTAVVPPTANTTNVSVNNLSNTATITITLSSEALAGGVSGVINTEEISALAGINFAGQTNVPFTIPQGQTTGTITIPIIP